MFHEDIEITKVWQKVVTNMAAVTIQLKGQGQLLVSFKQGPDSAAPSADEGLYVEGDGSYTAAGGLPENVDVWVRSKRDASERINVLAYSS